MSIERLKKDEFRVIRVKEKAIRELIYETIIEKSKDLFELPDINDVVFDFKLDLMNGDLICVAHKDSDSQNTFGASEISTTVAKNFYTTDSSQRNSASNQPAGNLAYIEPLQVMHYGGGTWRMATR